MVILIFFVNFDSGTKILLKQIKTNSNICETKKKNQNSLIQYWLLDHTNKLFLVCFLHYWFCDNHVNQHFDEFFSDEKFNSCLNLFELVDSCFSLTQLLEDVQRVLSVKIDEEDTKTLEIISEDFKTLRKIWNKVRQRPAQETLSGRFFLRIFFQDVSRISGFFWNFLEFFEIFLEFSRNFLEVTRTFWSFPEFPGIFLEFFWNIFSGIFFVLFSCKKRSLALFVYIFLFVYFSCICL